MYNCTYKYQIMKKLTLIILLAITFSACRYEEGPKVSFNSVKNRLVGEWAIDAVLINDADKTSDYTNGFVNYKLTIQKDGNYTLFYRPFNLIDYTESGVWILSDDKLKITFTQNKGNNPGNKATWDIKRLKNNSLWGAQKNSKGETELIKLKP